MVLDSCGFSRSVRQHGIVNYLARLERMSRVVVPIIEAHKGRVLRIEADNIFALFADPEAATRRASEGNGAFSFFYIAESGDRRPSLKTEPLVWRRVVSQLDYHNSPDLLLANLQRWIVKG
jgi:class 3 adenylate cyclase